MADKNINILDSNAEHLEMIRSLMEESDCQFHYFSSIPEFLEKMDRATPSLSLIEYNTILKSEREQVIGFFREVRSLNLIVYNVPQNANKRLAFYDLGARRVFDSSVSLEEVYQSIKWLLPRLTVAPQREDTYSKGRLEDIPLSVILRMLATEKRTGLLKINSGKSSGRIYLWNGQIDSAQVGAHDGNRALLHILMWDRGRFAFAVSGRAKSEQIISLSVPGIFILADEMKERFEQNVSLLGRGDSVLRLKNQGDLQMSSFDLHPEFVRYLSRPHFLNEVLENPFYTNYETAELLVKLFEGDFLHLKRPAEHVVEESIQQQIEKESAILSVDFLSGETDLVVRNLRLDELKNPKVVMLSPEWHIQSQLLSQLGSKDSHLVTDKGIKVARLLFKEDVGFYLVGLRMTQSSLEVIADLADSLAGYIFLLSVNDKEQFEYASYLIGQALKLAPAPAVVAVSDLRDERELEEMRSNFYLTQPIQWVVFDVNSMSDIKNVFLGIKEIEQPKQAEDESEEEPEEPADRLEEEEEE